MASQYAGWAINPPGFFAMGFGPLRAKARAELELFAKLGYSEDAIRGVLVLEGGRFRPTIVAAWGRRQGGCRAGRADVCRRAHASLAGGRADLVARVIETGLHKMETLGFDVRRVVSAMGTRRWPPTARATSGRLAARNDCILYGGQARLHVQADDRELTELAARLPASASADYGTPFYDIFERYDHDFYKIDPMLFSPAQVWLTSATSGRTFHAAGSIWMCCARRFRDLNRSRRTRRAARASDAYSPRWWRSMHIAILSARTGWQHRRVVPRAR